MQSDKNKLLCLTITFLLSSPLHKSHKTIFLQIFKKQGRVNSEAAMSNAMTNQNILCILGAVGKDFICFICYALSAILYLPFFISYALSDMLYLICFIYYALSAILYMLFYLLCFICYALSGMFYLLCFMCYALSAMLYLL